MIGTPRDELKERLLVQKRTNRPALSEIPRCLLLGLLFGGLACTEPPGERTENPSKKPQQTASSEENHSKAGKEEKTTEKGKTVEVKTFKGPDGWGYEVLVNGKKTIHQEHIPAIQGVHPFPTEEMARATGRLMARKIRKGTMPPTVTKDELDSLGVKW